MDETNLLADASIFNAISAYDISRPEFYAKFSKHGPVLTIAPGSGEYCYGKWVGGASIRAGATYAAGAGYTGGGGAEIKALISWAGEDGKYIVREFLLPADNDGKKRLYKKMRAPEGAAMAFMELSYSCDASITTPKRVVWSDIYIAEARPDDKRPVTLASAFFAPRRDMDKNLSAMIELIDAAGDYGADIVCFTENAYDRGAGTRLTDKCEAAPGRFTDALSNAAVKNNLYVIAGMTEEAEGYYYNTAVLIGRGGAIEGKYRKTHLPAGEKEAGYRPGASLKVFDTDFGRIGIMICFDIEYVEAARKLKNEGAEIIFIPTIGNYLTQSLVCAKRNGIYVAVAGSDGGGPSPSRVINPNGEVVAAAGPEDGLAIKKIDLSEGCYGPGTGFWPAASDARNALIMQRREVLY